MTPHLNLKNMLITGSCGFIGSHFIKLMARKYKDLKLISLDKLTYAGDINNIEELTNNIQHTFIKGDICDKHLIERIFIEHNIDSVVHFAAESHVDNSIESPEEFLKTNIDGTFHLLETARRIWLEKNLNYEKNCRFHHVSTDEVYGSLNPTEAAFTEATPYAPNSPYSASKASSDHLVRAYFHTYKLPITQSNCSNNFGPNQHYEKLIPVIIKNC